MDDTEKRDRILKAATAVFAKYGFYNSRISEIAKLANVANGTIYLYFRNKDDILISLFENEMFNIIHKIKKELKKPQTAEVKLKKFIKNHLALVDDNRQLAEVIQIELRQSNKFMKEYEGNKFREYLNIISSIIKEGQKNGEFCEDIIPGIAKRVIFGALDEISSYWVLTTHRKYNKETAVQLICDMFIHGMKKQHSN